MGSRLNDKPTKDVNPFVDEILRRAEAGELCCLSCAAGCGATDYAARICPLCGNSVELRPVSGRGRIYSYSVFHTQYNSKLPAPYTVLLVELEEGPRLAAVFDGEGGPPQKVGDAVVFSGAVNGIVRFSMA